MGIATEIKQVLPKNLHLAVLPKATKEAFLQTIQWDFLSPQSWYLAGGTALALQVGHRQSVDLDFFSVNKQFDIKQLEQYLLATRQWQTTMQQAGTLYGVYQKAKMSFIAYPFFKPARKLFCGNIRMLVPQDIAVMKIIAIAQRGRKRDFVDLFWYLRHCPDTLDALFLRVIKQYPKQQHNIPHLLKSLVYFTDAESDPMPELFFRVTWPEVKKYFRHEIPILTKRILNLQV